MDIRSFPVARTHLQALFLLSLLSRVVIAALIVSSAYLLPLFDSSPRLVLSDATPPWISSFLRWDAFHFVHVAQNGHAYEHAWAFLPALPLIMRLSGRVLSHLPLGLALDSDVAVAAPLLGTAVLAALLDSTRVLYRLSLHHLRSPSAAFLSAALSLISNGPAMLQFAPYTEPFFTYCSYQGMWACGRAKWASASAWFALASAFRSNGVLLAGFVAWGMVVEPWLSERDRKDFLTPSHMLHCAVLVALPLIPFVHHNHSGYVRFCTPPDLDRPAWCDRGLFPSIYAHVQERYWNVGFLRYWTASNVPNFALALPISASVYAFGTWYLARLDCAYPVLFSRLSERVGKRREETLRPSTSESVTDTRSGSLFLAPSLLPHVLHALALALLLTVNAHVQIALRVLPSLPVVHWGAAWLLIERPAWGRAWVAWSIVWGAVSCVLWAVFLPPA